MNKYFFIMKRQILYWCLSAMAITAGATNTPPVTMSIDSEEAFSQWVTYDNKGNSQFVYSDTYGGAFLAEDRSNPNDDWLISPAVELTAGMTYEIIATVRNTSTYSSDKTSFKITAGQGTAIEDQSNICYTTESFFKTSDYTTVDCAFTPEVTGEYNIGIYCFSKNYQGGFAVQSVSVGLRVSKPGKATDVTIVAGEKGAMNATISWTWPLKNSDGGDQIDLSGAYIYRGTNSTFAATESNLVHTYEGVGLPGESASWIDENIPSAGKYYYRVVPFDANGVAPSSDAVQSPYIGMATSIGQVQNLVAEPVADSETSVNVTFDAPSATEGYFDPELLAYRIVRVANGDTEVTLEENWTGEMPYVDNTIPGLASYQYKVYVVYNGSTAFTPTTSNKVVTGGTMALPYNQDFKQSTSFDLFTTFYGEEGTRTWTRNGNGYIIFWQSSGTADAYAVMPKFHLEAGKAYELSFNTWIQSYGATNYKHLYIVMGETPDVAGLNKELFDVNVEWQLSTPSSGVFSVEADGDYYIGFHCYGQTSSNNLCLDDILLQEVVATPVAVSDLTATPGAEGALEVELSWINPTKTTAGETLDTIEKVEIKRGDDVIAMLENLEPGATSTYTDTVESDGIYTYTVAAYMGENAGPAATVTTTWVGLDVPAAPTNVTVTVEEEGQLISFDAVTVGINGGYFDPAMLTYVIYRNDEVIADDVTETSYLDTDKDLPLATYVYGVAAKLGATESAITKAPAVVLGDALSLPYNADFSTSSTFDLWTSNLNQYGGKCWTYNASKEAMQSSVSGSATLFTPPFKARFGEGSLSFKATCYNYNYKENINVYLCKNNDPENMEIASVIVEDLEISSVSYPSTKTYEFDIPDTGTYYIAYNVPSVNWTISLYQTDISQLTVGVNTISGEGNLRYDAATATLYTHGGHTEVYNMAGTKVVSSDAEDISLETLAEGIYVIRNIDAANNTNVCKIAK